MYSSSNSFLGGGNSARPGPAQFGQSQQSFNGFQQPQQQPGPFASQPSGFGGQTLQPQFTGYPGAAPQQSFQSPQPQPQFTGFQPQSQPLQQGPPFQQPQQTSYLTPQPPQQQPPQQQQQPQLQTAALKQQQTSSQIAQSFQSPPAPPSSVSSQNALGKIPNIRLSFITATDQAKFEQLFKSAVGDGQALDGTWLGVEGNDNAKILQAKRRRISYSAQSSQEAFCHRYGNTTSPYLGRR